MTVKIMARGSREFRKQKAQSLVEFVIVLPLLVLLLVSTLHFGIIIWTFIQVNAATREGAIYAAYHPGDDAGTITTVKACLPSWVDQNPLYLTVGVVGEGSRLPGSRLKINTSYKIGSAGAVLPGGNLMPNLSAINAEVSTPVLVGTPSP